jgi:hypothetical protein
MRANEFNIMGQSIRPINLDLALDSATNTENAELSKKQPSEKSTIVDKLDESSKVSVVSPPVLSHTNNKQAETITAKLPEENKREPEQRAKVEYTHPLSTQLDIQAVTSEASSLVELMQVAQHGKVVMASKTEPPVTDTSTEATMSSQAAKNAGTFVGIGTIVNLNSNGNAQHFERSLPTVASAQTPVANPEIRQPDISAIAGADEVGGASEGGSTVGASLGIAVADSADTNRGDSTGEVSSESIHGFAIAVKEAFQNGGVSIEGVHVKYQGAEGTLYTNSHGELTFDLPSTLKSVMVTLKKEGYLSRRILLKRGRKIEVELVSNNALSMASRATQTNNDHNNIIFIELMDPYQQARQGYYAALVPVNTNESHVRGFMIDEQGLPSADLKRTSTRGQVMFLNVLPGTYILHVVGSSGEIMAPHIIDTAKNEGTVAKLSLGTYEDIQGSIIDGSRANPKGMNGVQVQVLGNPRRAGTNQKGDFNLGRVRIACDAQNYLQIEGQNVYRNRLDYKCGSTASSKYFALPQSYVDRVIEDSGARVSEMTGILFGQTRQAGLKVSLHSYSTGESQADEPRGLDFYFDEKRRVSPSLEKTTESKTYSIFNAESGLKMLSVYNDKHEVIDERVVLVSPSTVNLILTH